MSTKKTTKKAASKKPVTKAQANADAIAGTKEEAERNIIVIGGVTYDLPSYGDLTFAQMDSLTGLFAELLNDGFAEGKGLSVQTAAAGALGRQMFNVTVDELPDLDALSGREKMAASFAFTSLGGSLLNQFIALNMPEDGDTPNASGAEKP